MTTYETLNHYLLSKPESSKHYPFDNETAVYKVKDKMFALIGERNDLMMMNLKCDPDESPALRDIYPAITEGYHMNKKHWISIYFDGSVPEHEVLRLINNSYLLVVNKMSKKEKTSILMHL